MFAVFIHPLGDQQKMKTGEIAMYFEEIREGQQYRLEPITVTLQDILEFAKRYDPQRIHTDEKFATTGPYGGIIASGYHTLSLVWSRWIEADVMGDASMGGPGLERVQWLRPVRPGDTLYATVTIPTARLSRSQPKGIIGIHFSVVNQEGDPVMETEGAAFIQLRPSGQE